MDREVSNLIFVILVDVGYMTFLIRALYIIRSVGYEAVGHGEGLVSLRKDNPAARTLQRYADNGNPFP